MIELRQTVRRLRQSPGFTLAVILTLALGIGGTAAIFSVVNGILLKPLPFPESDRLIALKLTSRHGLSDINASPAIYLTYRDNNRTFDSVALYLPRTNSITGSGDPEQVQSLAATHEFLPTLGVAPFLGRAFSEADDLQGNPKTVMLSHGYWQRHFGGAEDALGNTLIVDGEPHSVIGVLPQGFRSPLGSAGFWSLWSIGRRAPERRRDAGRSLRGRGADAANRDRHVSACRSRQGIVRE
jgi:hypothetical protein